MCIVRLTDIHKRQCHENKGLQGNNQNMEDCPSCTSNNVEDEQDRIHQAHALPEAAQAPPNKAISKNTNSPAYILPNNRIPCETVF